MPRFKIEFLGGKTVVYTEKNLPYSALANSSYSNSLHYFNHKKADPNPAQKAWTSHSLERFSKAAKMVSNYDPNSSSKLLDYGFEILHRVRSPYRTQWSILYDITNRKVIFHTLQSPNRKRIALNDFQLNCDTAIKVLDINTKREDAVSGYFVDYTTAINRDLVYAAYKRTSFMQNTPNHELDRIARYPESFRCIR